MGIDKLVNVHPSLQDKVARIKFAMAELGFPMVVTDGVRTDAEQALLYTKGRNLAGQIVDPSKVVTYRDGLHKRSNHQIHPDTRFGHAIDMCFLVDGKPSWAESNPWTLYGVMAEALGLSWGGRWQHPVDRPHIEMV